MNISILIRYGEILRERYEYQLFSRSGRLGDDTNGPAILLANPNNIHFELITGDA